MNKAELILAVAKKTGLTRKEADKAVCAMIDTITETLVAGDKVQIMGFGTFEVKERAAHKGHNPITQEEIEIAATRTPSFKAGKHLKEDLRN